MMKRPRRNHSLAPKAEVAAADICSGFTIAAVAPKFATRTQSKTQVPTRAQISSSLMVAWLSLKLMPSDD
jgi:hypothetical protein